LAGAGPGGRDDRDDLIGGSAGLTSPMFTVAVAVAAVASVSVPDPTLTTSSGLAIGLPDVTGRKPEVPESITFQPTSAEVGCGVAPGVQVTVVDPLVKVALATWTPLTIGVFHARQDPVLAE
jgi:hypothetical protein